MRILVIGKNGQLGRSIQEVILNSKVSDDYILVGRKELDLSNHVSVSNYFKNNIFDIIVNCAAYTKVDQAQKEIELANQVNHLAVLQIAKIANKQKAKFIHISSDYVFDGKKNSLYTETDNVNPINIYGKTKLAGEKAIKKEMQSNIVIIRTSWVYSEFGNNFLKTILGLGKERESINVVSDQISSPTYAKDLADVILKIINNKDFQKKQNPNAIYHYSNEGEVSWYDFAKEIFKLAEIKCKINPILTSQYNALAKRPKNTSMDNSKIKEKFDINLYLWKNSLQMCLTKLLVKIPNNKDYKKIIN